MQRSDLQRNPMCKGFTIVELLVTLSIVAVLALLALPRLQMVIIAGRVDPTAADINKIVAKVRATFNGQGAAPFGAIDTASFANVGRQLVTSLEISGTGATTSITHALGVGHAAIQVSPSTIAVANDSYTVTLNAVDEAACAIGLQMGKTAEVVTLNTTTVKASATSAYLPAVAQTACLAGEVNVFTFTFR